MAGLDADDVVSADGPAPFDGDVIARGRFTADCTRLSLFAAFGFFVGLFLLVVVVRLLLAVLMLVAALFGLLRFLLFPFSTGLLLVVIDLLL